MNMVSEPVQDVLDLYASLVRERLPERVMGFYVHGSIALGAYEHGFSDIDFFAVLNKRALDADCEVLRGIHRDVAVKYDKPILEGSYLQLQDLGRLKSDVEPAPYYYEDQFRHAGHHDLNLVTWWVLKHRGIAVWGSPCQDLPFEVDWDVLIRRMAENLHDYWAPLIQRVKKDPATLDEDMVQWSVLGILRLFYSFREGDITSKVGAGEYGLEVLSEKWHCILNESIRIRQGGTESLYDSPEKRADDTLGFMDNAFLQCVDEIEKLGVN